MKLEGTEAVLSKLSDIGVVPVIRTHSQELAYRAVMTLADVGFQTVEITMTVPGAVELLHELSRKTDLLLGAGTILEPGEAAASIRAGAHYIVSPSIVEGLPPVCQDAGVPCLMGGLTPREIWTAWKLGSSAVKVFPAQAVGGPEYLKAIKAVFPFIPLVPTGGVSLGNTPSFLRAGAAFVGAGSDLVNLTALQENDLGAISTLGRKYLQAVAEVRNGG